MFRTLVCAAVFACLVLAAHAKPVLTDTIELVPPVAPAGTAIPAEDTASEPPDEPGPAVAADPAGEMPPLQVQYDPGSLPPPVRRMREQLREAAIRADLDRLRMVLESNEVPPTLSLTAIGDPIEFIKTSSGDGEGYETLAILLDVLDAGFVHVDQGTPQEMYVWPYFARYPLHELTADQKVELYRIVTSGDFEEMMIYGVWTFYRVGIGPDGTLHYFVAGE
ncbi:hypothetical protein GCM10011316_24670 [Roseibium aquae]|uniref:Uncharacterized protein n=1 Tax=Roseibium aquae TaxID=1323746 RepID=A0A916TL95_9HYPH|nr:hypothetical protein [Roseibium aquae]GGB51735.1 hypothetical protein GCM10011316_24670 [Roseibium aquae]